MKTKMIRWSFAATAVFFLSVSCGEDFVTTKPDGLFFEDNYYKNETQAFSGLLAVYDVLRKNSNGFENMITMFNAGSDDFYAGGGGATDGTGIQSFSNYTIDEATIPGSYWNDYYAGIARANILIEKLPAADFGNNEAARTRFLAEARALRAYYYFQLVTMFKNIPLITTRLEASELFNVPQADPAEVYAFIEAEMLESLEDLPVMLPVRVGDDLYSREAGRLTQGAVKALLGKVYLYQQKWSQAAAQLADVNGTPGGTSMYGYKLVDNFADLWSVSNKFNTESILEVYHTNQSNSSWGNWGSGSDEGNSVNQMVGPRGYSRPSGSTAPDFWPGWAFNPATPGLAAAMAGDPRAASTLLDMSTVDATYAPAYMDTGFFLRKFMPLNGERTTGGGTAELNFQQDTYLVRLADTYLMEAEAIVNGGGDLTRAQQLLDAVRDRVGLGSIPATEQNIFNERRLELAGEGFRWFDIVRTGRGTALLGSRGFQANKNEVLPIPLRERQNTVIDQNEGYNN
ncbi:RagB/SusD family nutrient uptake outer membrane protein [Flavobacterium selenitireducens]|uniref:RagB/SusD family nutrient uptake outer membrane protein n=1 Tax=Flavobacterium selenitireducens TaxID=2722704 RepID=UPI00168AE21E|nr:RagB/SusD family nutrient uptake outer membrane protein [Flavobacterium selenitireducens]MBD3583653.1 RagB/SusD family nutrient uptake outer membrane protein [Flavobacterium selenitireducens]